MVMMHRLFLSGLACMAAIAAPLSAHAYTVSPMTYELAPTGSRATARVTIVNSAAAVLNYEVQSFRVEVDDAGKRTFTPADADFQIFPPQGTIQPGATQALQVRCIVNSAIDKGRLYVVRIKQLNPQPIDSPSNDKGGVMRLGLAVNFNTTVLVQPANLKADVMIMDQPKPVAGGGLALRVQNNGDAIVDLSTLPWLAKSGETNVRLNVSLLKFGETPMLQPGKTRTIFLPSDMTGAVSVSLAKR